VGIEAGGFTGFVAGATTVFVVLDGGDDLVVVAFVLIEERQLLRPPRVEEVVVFAGRPRCVFTGPVLVSLRCTKSSRSARRCACSARASLSSRALIR
jgi:hypothetical protein